MTTADPSPPPPSIRSRVGVGLAGWAITIALLLLLFAGWQVTEAVAAARFEAVLLREGATLWWREDGLGMAPMFVAAILPTVFVPMAFGGLFGRTGHLEAWPERWRWRTVMASAALIPIAVVVGLTFGGGAGGFVTADGAAWFRRDAVVARQPWSTARVLQADCETFTSRRRTSHEIQYLVWWADGRKAPLSSLEPMPVTDWIDAVAPIDAALRASGARREGAVAEDCLVDRAEGDPAAVARLRAVLAR